MAAGVAGSGRGLTSACAVARAQIRIRWLLGAAHWLSRDGVVMARNEDRTALHGVSGDRQDLCGSLLARELEADVLVIRHRRVAAVYLDWGQPTQRIG
jgi:hypothetical protein